MPATPAPLRSPSGALPADPAGAAGTAAPRADVPGAGGAGPGAPLSSGALAAALGRGLAAIAAFGALGVGFWWWRLRRAAAGSTSELDAAWPYFGVGLAAAAFAAMLAVWLHGRIANGRALPGAPLDGRIEGMRLQALLAAAFGAKLAVLAAGVFVLLQVPLRAAAGGDDAGAATVKFTDIATFGVSFAGASLVCQLATAAALANSLRRRPRGAA